MSPLDSYCFGNFTFPFTTYRAFDAHRVKLLEGSWECAADALQGSQLPFTGGSRVDATMQMSTEGSVQLAQ